MVELSDDFPYFRKPDPVVDCPMCEDRAAVHMGQIGSSPTGVAGDVLILKYKCLNRDCSCWFERRPALSDDERIHLIQNWGNRNVHFYRDIDKILEGDGKERIMERFRELGYI